MGAGIVQFREGVYSYKWANATDSVVGYGATMTADETVNIANANTDFPMGIIGSAVKQNEFVKIYGVEGIIIEAVCGAAITADYTNGQTVTVDSTGRFISASKSATQAATRKYFWGIALKSTTAAGQKFPLLFARIETDVA